MVDFSRRCDEVVQAKDPKAKQTLQVTYLEGQTCSVPFEEASFQHLQPELIEKAQDFDKVVLLHPETQKRRVLKDNNGIIDPFYEN